MPASRILQCDAARIDGQWVRDVRIGIDSRGNIASVTRGAANATGDASAVLRGDAGDADHAGDVSDLATKAATEASSGPQPMVERVGFVLPGMVNAHSHAFQRAMVGLTEIASGRGDDFWSWREWMYKFMAVLQPDDIEAIAAQLQVECLLNGYTSIVEFHYVHHDPAGRPYANLVEMGDRLFAAARESGIGLTLAPVLYAYAGFDSRPLAEPQRRFAGSPEQILQMLQLLRPRVDDDTALAIAPHSLRAASVAQIRELVQASPADRRFHIHAAEQLSEVEQCLAATGCRPVRLLLDQVGLDDRWCVVHATHLDDLETRDLATSGATAGLCPSTEADLGDGLFPFNAFTASGGCIAIGSDSQVSRNPFSELRLLEFGQRLATRQRNLASRAPGAPVGDALWDAALAGGARTTGRAVGRIAVGMRADLVALALDDAAVYALPQLLNQAVFNDGAARVEHVMVGGQWRVRDRCHTAADAVAMRYRAVMKKLLDA